jgi:hypothetical protein
VTGAQFGGVDIDLLADYLGGALAGTPEESVVAARIADDPAWREAYASLGEGVALVSAELGRLGPEPMPADLADRLDALLTGDTAPVAPARHLSVVDGGLASGDAANPVREKRPPGRRLRWAAPIAVAAGVVAFVGFGLDYLHGRSQSSDASTDSAAGSSEVRGKAPAAARPIAPGQTLASGTDYTHATLGAEPPPQPFGATETSPQAGPDAAPDLASGIGAALRRLSAPAALQDCLDAIAAENAGGTLSVESVDYARFAGRPAVIVRFVAANGHWAWASGADCGTRSAGAATLDKVPVG